MKKILILFCSFLAASTIITPVDKIVILTVPKTGTHLLDNCVRMITGKKDNGWSLRGIDWNFQYGHVHVYNQTIPADAKIITMLRDPRDVVISTVTWLYHRQALRDHNKTLKQLITEVIINPSKGIANFSQRNLYYPKSESIEQYYTTWFIPLLTQSNCYVASFEKLVGPQGGGSLEAQYAEIRAIARHIGIDLSDERVREIGENIFGGSFTFYKGQIGNWKWCFTREQAELFKKSAGDILIRLGYESGSDW